MKFISILSVAACIFGSFVAASPVAAPSLVARDDSAGQPVVDRLTTLQGELTTVHTKWSKNCEKSCSTGDISSWQSEAAAVLTKGANDCKGLIPKGFVFGSPTICINILVAIILELNTILYFLLGKCGLLGGLLSIVILLLGLILGTLKDALTLIFVILTPCIPKCHDLVYGSVTLVLGVVISLLSPILCIL